MNKFPRVDWRAVQIMSTPPRTNWIVARIMNIASNLRFPLDKAYVLYQVHSPFRNITRYWAYRATMKTWTTSVDKTMKIARMVASTKQLANFS